MSTISAPIKAGKKVAKLFSALVNESHTASLVVRICKIKGSFVGQEVGKQNHCLKTAVRFKAETKAVRETMNTATRT
jgi:hypothetical protein